MVALEALSAGIPLITYDIEGLKWIPSDVRITVPPFSIKELSTAISDVLTNDTVRHQLQEKGEQYAKKFTWSNVTKQYQSVIDNLVN
jgi:glycosyltransferase involved in cell wall biosynthesis